MSKEICISSTPHETRLAILEDEQLTEVYYERENEYTLAGSIYKGRVTRVLPGMQSAFVDLGLERDAFLYVTDFMEEQEDSSDFERIPANGEETGRGNQGRQARENREPRQPRAAAAPEEEAPRRNGVPASSGGAGQGAAGEFEDGTRKWRGRRGRRKGFRPPQGGQQAAQEHPVSSRTDAPPRTDVPPVAAVEPGPRAPVAFSLTGV
jgi:ribonuclease E